MASHGQMAPDCTGSRLFGMSPVARISRPSLGVVLRLAIMVAGFAVLGSVFFQGAGDRPPETWILVSHSFGMVVSFVGLLLQRRNPEQGLIVTAVGMTFMALGFYYGVALGLALVIYETYFIASTLNLRRRLWLVILVTGAIIGMNAFGALQGTHFGLKTEPADWSRLMDSSTALGMLTSNIFLIIAIDATWRFGRGRRRRRLKMEELEAKAELAAVSERNRIAREMHDIVAHSLTIVIAQADGGRYAGRKDPHKAIEALETISDRGRDALGQLRSLLSVLRDGDGPESRRSVSTAPGVSSIPSLIDDAKRSGVRAYFEQFGSPAEGQVSDLLELTLYRIVQESLTNVLKHAGPVEALVQLLWAHDHVLLRVDNESGQDQIEGSGRGLDGIAERVRIHGGSVNWGDSQVYEGGWNVSAMVPLS